jgi:hypothetical protein
MTFPPSIMVLQINKVNLWLPVFLLWPLLAVASLALMPVACLVPQARYGRPGISRPLMGLSALAVLSNLRGLSVRVSSGAERVTVMFM